MWKIKKLIPVLQWRPSEVGSVRSVCSTRFSHVPLSSHRLLPPPPPHTHRVHTLYTSLTLLSGLMTLPGVQSLFKNRNFYELNRINHLMVKIKFWMIINDFWLTLTQRSKCSTISKQAQREVNHGKIII